LLKQLPDNSIDSVVTDPPYGLSGKNSSKRIFDAFQRSFNIVFPNLDKSDISGLKYSDLVRVSLQGSGLSRAKVLNVIKPFISVPESPVDFDCDIKSRDEEINASGVSACYNISNFELGKESDVKRYKYIGNYIFDFGNAFDFPGSDLRCGNIGEFGFSFFTMPISSVFAPCFPNGKGDSSLDFRREGIDDAVRVNNNSWREAFSPSFILASGRAENKLVLRFDLADTTSKLNATISATNSGGVSQFVSPKLIRTSATASGLAAKLQPCCVRFITASADGTNSFYYFHLYIPHDLFQLLHNSFKNASGFMGKKWDYDVPTVELWREVYRVLKPGGHMLVACGTRTQHRMAVNIEDAGFEIRDIVAWVYGSGFPKSKNVGLAIDKGEGFPDRGHRIATASRHHPDGTFEPNGENIPAYEAKTELGKQWQGFGTALKPAMELWTLARKPLKGTVAENVLKYGTGGLNIDGCRVATEDIDALYRKPTIANIDLSGAKFQKNTSKIIGTMNNAYKLGRFPANIIHDGSEEVVKLFPNTESKAGVKTLSTSNI